MMRIKGVKLKEMIKHSDDRGYFMEILRSDEHLLDKFGQTSLSVSYPGVIKAYHYHKNQDDLWFFSAGNAQVVLYDRREDSATRGERNIFYLGEDNPVLLTIPRGVIHGYRVLGNQSATILYFTSEPYNKNNPDEYRLPWNDPQIGFDWETRNR
ncbi:MAG: dTDP-4-dehydrorhamnose 3,5-epimerase family protein [Halanaerobiales bacterium]|nr:dTDP-4-dehydrorhamnose 3,5-epimerase family protein [Halanaerobiales bacterium]